jgi:hypothetical protein
VGWALPYSAAKTTPRKAGFAKIAASVLRFRFEPSRADNGKRYRASKADAGQKNGRSSSSELRPYRSPLRASGFVNR